MLCIIVYHGVLQWKSRSDTIKGSLKRFMGVFDFLKNKKDESATDDVEEKAVPDVKADAAESDSEASEKRLLFFYGDECPHCHSLMPTVAQVEKELGVKFERFEVWHNSENAEILKGYDRGFCGGVPFLYNTASNDWICGNVDPDKVHAFASKG